MKPDERPKRILQVVLTEEERAAAVQPGQSASARGRVLVTKGMRVENIAATAQQLVDSGNCSSLAEAEKLLRFLNGGPF